MCGVDLCAPDPCASLPDSDCLECSSGSCIADNNGVGCTKSAKSGTCSAGVCGKYVVRFPFRIPFALKVGKVSTIVFVCAVQISALPTHALATQTPIASRATPETATAVPTGADQQQAISWS